MTSLPVIMPGAEPFFYRGNQAGILCLHGFTASPSEMSWLGQHLAGEGYTVYGLRTPGHGTDPHDLDRYLWQDWFAAVLDGYHLLRAQCDRVVVVGHSMGGLLGLLLACAEPVNGLVVLASPLLYADKRLAYANWMAKVMPYTEQPDTSNLPQRIRAAQAERGEPVRGRVRYETWSTKAVGQLYGVTMAAAERLPDVTAPLLAIYSKGDVTVGLESRDFLLAQVGSQQVESHTLEHSDHILPQDVERETVFQLVSAFAGRVLRD
ncbi:MAG TPA: alpha/beta fold hydrolase [Aggregatilineales bacterium]|nr:alpha/beta fold hydrolase [Aggregatilineales bacterium]